MSPAKTQTVIPALSQSRYELMACPHLYHQRMVLGIQDPENEYSLRGTQIHEVLSKYIDYLVEARAEFAPQYFQGLLETMPLLPEAREILEGLQESLKLPIEQVLGTEMGLQLDEEMRPWEYEPEMADAIKRPIAVQGTLDLVLCPSPTEAEIWDWKSFYQIIEADTFQSKLYPFLLLQHYPGIQTVRFKLQFVRYGMVSREVTWTRAQLPELERLVRGERQRQIQLHQGCPGIALGDGNYSGCSGGADCPECKGQLMAPMPGAHCGYCTKLNRCPIKDVNPFATQTPGDRVAFALWLAAAKKENDRVLKAFCEAQGAIAISDGNGRKYGAGFQLTEKKSYPAATVFPIVKSEDPEIAGKLTLSGLGTPLRAKKRAALAEKLAPLVVTTTATRFGIRGIDEDDDGEE